MEYDVKTDIMDGVRWLELAQNYAQLCSVVLLMLNFQSLQPDNI
jgi:hypothetical protein